jgi:peptidoglycan hydrolase-like protein with peptidoglycan-binding domain
MSEKRYKVPIPVRPEDLYASREKVEPAGAFVVSGGVVDEVRLSAVVYRNVMSRKSLTVHHLQRRLNELGFTSAYLDKDGWFDEGTKSAIRLFQEANDLPPTGMVDADTMTKIFDGDPNVLVVLD